MKIKSITTFNSYGLPIISPEEWEDIRTNDDPLARQIFHAILNDNIDFIKNAIEANNLDINSYIVDIGQEECCTPLLKLAVCQESISYKIAKYLLELTDLNINAYGSNGENTLLGLCSLPAGYWQLAYISSSPRKEIATLLINNQKIKLDAIKYNFNTTTGDYEQSEIAEQLALKNNNNYMANLIVEKLKNGEVQNDTTLNPMIQFHQHVQQMVKQAQEQTQEILSNANSTNTLQTELVAFKNAIEAAKNQLRNLRYNPY